VNGEHGKMVTIIRESNAPYRSSTGLVPLESVRERTMAVPRDWISEDGMSVTEQFLEYAGPLAGEIPPHSVLARHAIERKCAPYTDPGKK